MFQWWFNGKRITDWERTCSCIGRENNDTVMDMIGFLIENCKGKTKIVTNKRNKKNSSCKYQFVGHNASGFDNYLVLKSLPKMHTNTKITSGGLLELSFKTGPVFKGDRELSKYVKFVCSKCHISGSLKSIQKNTTYNYKY